MDELELFDAWTQPIVSDLALADPKSQTPEGFNDFMVARAVESLCSWPKCPHKIDTPKGPISKPIFCSKECEEKAANVFKARPKHNNNPIGKIVEKDVGERPPKKITRFGADDIEGMKVRVGAYHEVLDEIESWIGGYPVSPYMPLTENQKKLFDITDKAIKCINATLKHTPDTNYFFNNIDVRNYKLFEDTDDKFKRIFGYAMYEVMTGTDMGNEVKREEFPFGIYNDLVETLGTLQFLDEDN